MGTISSTIEEKLAICFLPSTTPKFHRRHKPSASKILLLGLDNAGKTDLLRNITQNESLQNRPTIGYNAETIRLRSFRRSKKVTLWDCGGKMCLRKMWPYYYSDTSVLVWLINSNDRSRLEESLNALTTTLNDTSMYKVPLLVVLYRPLNIMSSSYQQGYTIDVSDEAQLTSLELAFRLSSKLPNIDLKWQVINVTGSNQKDLRKVNTCLLDMISQ